MQKALSCRYILGLLRDTAGHGGCKMLRRMMEVVSVWDISSIADTSKRALAERKAIRIGARWLLERKRVTTVDDLIAIVREEMAIDSEYPKLPYLISLTVWR